MTLLRISDESIEKKVMLTQLNQRVHGSDTAQQAGQLVPLDVVQPLLQQERHQLVEA